MGVPGGGVERIFGPHLTAVLPIQHRGPKGNLMEEEWGLLAGGGSTESWAHLTAVLLIQRIDRCTVYRFPFAHARWAAIASPVERCSLGVSTWLPIAQPGSRIHAFTFSN